MGNLHCKDFIKLLMVVVLLVGCKEVAESNTTKTLTLSTDTFINTTTGNYVGQGLDVILNNLANAFIYRGRISEGRNSGIQPVDNLNVNKVYK